MDNQAVQKISKGLLLIFWALLLGIVAPNLVGFAFPFVRAIFQTGPGFYPHWLRFIHPCLGVLGLLGAFLVVTQGRPERSQHLLRSGFAVIALVEVGLSFAIVFFRQTPYTNALSISYDIAKILLITVSAGYFRALSLRFNFKTLARSWLLFLIAYWLSAVILSSAIGYYFRPSNDPFLLSLSKSDIFDIGFYCVLNVPVFIWGLSLILTLRTMLNHMDK